MENTVPTSDSSRRSRRRRKRLRFLACDCTCVCLLLFIGCQPGPSTPETGSLSRSISIHQIQGFTETSPFENQTVTTKGVVTADFQEENQLQGFFLQAIQTDHDPATSEGIFVYAPGSQDVRVGNLVEVTGTVQEYHGLTEITKVRSLSILASTTPLPVPTPISLPLPGPSHWERYEGMLVTFTTPLVISQNYFVGRFGQLTLSAQDRMFQPTQVHPAGTEEMDRLLSQYAANSIVLDDGSSSQNPFPIPYVEDFSGTIRCGDKIVELTGVLDFGPVGTGKEIRGYRLHPTKPPLFSIHNSRPPQPPALRESLRIGAFNVWNFFTTIDTTANRKRLPYAPRGADSLKELERQSQKLSKAIAELGTHALALMEVENNGDTALLELVKAINRHARSPYSPVIPAASMGQDAIRVAIIYQPDVLEPVGSAHVFSDPIFVRPPLLQTFRHISSGHLLTMVSVHMKSKSTRTPPAGPDVDRGDGQGAYNHHRTQEVRALLRRLQQFKAEHPDYARHILLMGDFNAYAREEPLQLLEQHGYVNVITKHISNPYSYVFDGKAGLLDHAFATHELVPQVKGAAIWHINADESPLHDYNTEYKQADFFADHSFRSSDHDPILIGIAWP